MYNSERSYVYNKALWEAFTNMNSLESLVDQIETRTWTFDNIRAWAKERGIYEKGNSHTQFVKLQEEAGELAKALLNKDRYEIKDAIGVGINSKNEINIPSLDSMILHGYEHMGEIKAPLNVGKK